MNRTPKTCRPLFLFILLLTLACVTLEDPFGRKPAAQPSLPPSTEAPTETVPAPIPTQVPSRTPTSAPKAQALPPSATLFPEKQLRTVTDQTKAIQANLPAVWTDLRTEAWKDQKGQIIGTIFTASTKIEAFQKFQAEGVEISVSRHLPVGYIQLLEAEYAIYVKSCADTYKTRWPVEDPVYTGKYFVFGECVGQRDTWLSLFSVVNKQGPEKYIARVVGYDMIPTYGETFRQMIMNFKVFPENLP